MRISDWSSDVCSSDLQTDCRVDVEGTEASHLPLKNEFQSLRPRCRAKRPVPQVLNVSDRLTFCIFPKVFPPALDLDKARCFATQLHVVTTFRDHDGGRSLTGQSFHRKPRGDRKSHRLNSS